MFARTKNLIRRWTDSNADISLDDRRVHPRFEVGVTTVCRLPDSGSGDIRVTVRDISRGGIGLRVGRPIEEGSLICVELPQNDSNTPVEVLACVMNSVPLSGGQYDLGCTFSAELGADDLSHFGARKEFANPADQRVWRRFLTHGEVRIRKLPVDPALVAYGRIVNISPSGVGFVVDQDIEPGTALRLDLQRDEGGRSVSILACAVYKGEKTEEGWLLGCNFIHELTSQDLNALL